MDLQETLTPVVTIGLNRNASSFDYSMTELNNLAEANNMKVVETLVQKLESTRPCHLFW